MSWGALAAAITAPAGARRVPAAAWHRPNHLAAIDIAGVFGLDSDGAPVSRAEAMSVPAMARARHLVCTPARLPIVTDPPGYPMRALIEQPDPARTRQAVISDTLDALLFYGAAVWRVTARYAADDRPRRAEFVALDRVTIDPDTGATLVDGRPVPARDLLWFEGPHEGVLAFAGRALRAAVRLDRAYAATAANPAVAVELHHTGDADMTDDDIRDVVDAARRAIADRGVLYTGGGLEVRTHAAAAENLLISGRNAAAVDIARIVGLPAPSLDAHAPGSSGTYTNAAARLREARDMGADTYMSAITSRLSLDDVLPRGVVCRVDWDPLLRPDFAERMAGYSAAQAAGVYTAEECRAMEAPRNEESDTP